MLFLASLGETGLPHDIFLNCHLGFSRSLMLTNIWCRFWSIFFQNFHLTLKSCLLTSNRRGRPLGYPRVIGGSVLFIQHGQKIFKPAWKSLTWTRKIWKAKLSWWRKMSEIGLPFVMARSKVKELVYKYTANVLVVCKLICTWFLALCSETGYFFNWK